MAIIIKTAGQIKVGDIIPSRHNYPARVTSFKRFTTDNGLDRVEYYTEGVAHPGSPFWGEHTNAGKIIQVQA